MPFVTVHYKVYLPGGHHRQPRNASAEIDVNNPAPSDAVADTPFTPPHFDQVQYTLNNATGLAQLLFWSATDGTQGKTYPAGDLTVQVGDNPLTITAWYFPISGPGLYGGGPAIIDDAFSAVKGDFIDDTFVTVTSDASLTSQANVVGIVPTLLPETLVAAHSVPSTNEPFSQWRAYGAGTATGDTLAVPAKAVGLGIAFYERSDVAFNTPSVHGTIVGTVIGGVSVDGGGSVIINGVGHPVDPWGPLIVMLAQLALANTAAGKVEPALGAQLRRLTASGAVNAIKAALPSIERSAGG